MFRANAAPARALAKSVDSSHSPVRRTVTTARGTTTPQSARPGKPDITKIKPTPPTPQERARAKDSLEAVLGDIRVSLKNKIQPHDNVPLKVVEYLQNKYDLNPLVRVDDFVRADVSEVSKGLSQLAVATQRAAALFGLEVDLLSGTLSELNNHIHTTLELGNSNKGKYPADYFQKEFVLPLTAQRKDLELKCAEAKRRQSEAQARFEALRQEATKPLMEQLQRSTVKYETAFHSIPEEDLHKLQQVIDSAGQFNRQELHQRPQISRKQLRTSRHKSMMPLGADDGDANSPAALPTNSFEYLQLLYADGSRAQMTLQTVLECVENYCRKRGVTVEVEMAGLKAVERAMEKAVEEYEGDFSRLLDLARGSVVCEDMSSFIVAVEELTKLSKQTLEISTGGKPQILKFEIVRIKNRLSPQYLARSHSGGYRDVLINIRVNDEHLCEVQIQYNRFLKLKHGGGHRAYAVARSLHLLDADLGHVRVADIDSEEVQNSRTGVRASLSRALQRVESGTCQTLSLDHVRLNIDECQALNMALHAPACSVRAISLMGCGLDRERSLVLCGKETLQTIPPEEQIPNVDPGREKMLGYFKTVNLYGNKDIAGECVAAFISAELESLVLQQCHISVGEFYAICEALQKNTKHLHTLNLDENDVCPEGAVCLNEALQHAEHLTDLNLFGTGLKPEGAMALAPALSHMTKLNTLYLSRNDIGDVGGEALVPALSKMTNMTELYLSQNNFEASSLAPALSELVLMQQMSFSNNKGLGPDGGVAFSNSIARMTSLKELYLNNNAIGDIDIGALASALTQLAQMTILQLRKNQIGDSGAMAIAASVPQMPQLLRLWIDENHIGEEGTKALVEAFATHPTINDIIFDVRNLSGDVQAWIEDTLIHVPNVNDRGIHRP